jgi:hypothetical protein
MEQTQNNELENLRKQNKKLKREKNIFTITSVIILIIMLYDYFA